MEDITYCSRDCANYKCRRNKYHNITTSYAFYGDFNRCDEYIKPTEETGESYDN